MSLSIIPVLCNEKNMANYAYILHDKKNNLTLIIDAAEASPIEKKLKELNLHPDYILTTHHHFDHVEGNLELKQKYNLQIIAPAKEFSEVPGADIKAEENKDIKLKGINIKVIAAPGHTLGHVLYYIEDEKALFTGDVLFNLCIGGLFEGTPKQMFDSLQKIKSLDDNTKIFPGHEYTRNCLSEKLLKNKDFAPYLEKMIARENNEFAPTTIKEEKLFNPYLQIDNLNDF